MARKKLIDLCLVRFKEVGCSFKHISLTRVEVLAVPVSSNAVELLAHPPSCDIQLLIEIFYEPVGSIPSVHVSANITRFASVAMLQTWRDRWVTKCDVDVTKHSCLTRSRAAGLSSARGIAPGAAVRNHSLVVHLPSIQLAAIAARSCGVRSADRTF